MRKLACVLVLLAAAVAPAAAQENDETPPRIAALEKALAQGQGEDFFPDLVDPNLLDAQGKQAQHDALRAYYEYQQVGFDHRRRVFEWQLLSSRLIFVLVIALVAVGVYFSWLQFRRGLRPDYDPDTPQTTTLEASARGVKISSPVLGVIILTISLVFFYLYLVHVYPIEEIL
jgi:hypothetical protein